MPVTASWISKKPDRCGGDACVRDSRITVWGLVAQRRLGMSNDEIMHATQGVTAADLEAAWEYAAAHSDEIDEAIRANEADEASLNPLLDFSEHLDPNDPLEKEFVEELARARQEDLEETIREDEQECRDSSSTPTT